MTRAPLRNAPLSNAERQARHRARVKEKLSEATAKPAETLRNELKIREEMADAILARLSRAYYGQADVFRKHISGDHVDHYVEGAITEFLAEKYSFDDIIKIVELAGYARVGDFFSLHCSRSDRLADPPEWISHADRMKARGVT